MNEHTINSIFKSAEWSVQHDSARAYTATNCLLHGKLAYNVNDFACDMMETKNKSNGADNNGQKVSRQTTKPVFYFQRLLSATICQQP